MGQVAVRQAASNDDAGMAPLNWLWLSHNSLQGSSGCPTPRAMRPLNWLLYRYRPVRPVRLPNAVGMLPVNWLPARYSSFRTRRGGPMQCRRFDAHQVRLNSAGFEPLQAQVGQAQVLRLPNARGNAAGCRTMVRGCPRIGPTPGASGFRSQEAGPRRPNSGMAPLNWLSCSSSSFQVASGSAQLRGDWPTQLVVRSGIGTSGSLLRLPSSAGMLGHSTGCSGLQGCGDG